MTALTLGLFAALAWGLHDFLVRFISQRAPIGACVLFVLSFGLLIQIGITTATAEFIIPARDAVTNALLAGAFFVLANFGLYWSFQRGPVWLAAPLVACFSVITVGVAALSGTYISAAQWGAIGVILAGISIVAALSNDNDAEIPAKGPTALYALLAAIGFAGMFEFGQAATELSNPMMSAFGTRIFAIIVLIAVMFAFRMPFWPGRNALWVLALMGVSDCLAILAIVSAGGLANEQYAAVTTSMYGLPAILLASIFLGEKMNWLQWGGCLLAFAGVGYLAL